MFSLSWSKLSRNENAQNGRSRLIRTMPTFTWRLDEPLIRGSANPTDEDLQALRAEGFAIAVSLLVESIQPPRYDKQSALTAGWFIHSIPIAEDHPPSIGQIHEFMARLTRSPERAK